MALDIALMTGELMRDEAMILFAYDDGTGAAVRQGSRLVGHPTIGIGRCLETKGISAAEAKYMLANDIAEYLADLSKFPWFVRLDPVRQRAVLNMRHQLGLAGLLRFPVMIAALSARKWKDAAAAGYASQWRLGCPERAGRVLAMILTGSADGPPYKPPEPPDALVTA